MNSDITWTPSPELQPQPKHGEKEGQGPTSMKPTLPSKWTEAPVQPKKKRKGQTREKEFPLEHKTPLPGRRAALFAPGKRWR